MNTSYSPIYKMEFRRLPLLALLFCLPLFSTPVRGQTNEISLDVPRIVPVSPAVTEMGKYQSYPVSHCTGIPDITIPLYEIVAGEVTIPVTLSYHASGLKPKERSGIAGTGWTLNLEPSVSRQINGVPDEAYSSGWFYRGKPSNVRPNDRDELKDYYSSKLSNHLDTRPDKFTYKLANSGGSGYFQTNLAPMWTVPRNNDNVDFHNTTSIEITDENGVRYNFEGNYEKSGDYVTRWPCSSIHSARPQRQVLASFSYLSPRYYMHPDVYNNLDGQLAFIDRERDGGHEMFLTEQENGNKSYYRVQPPEDSWSSGSSEAVLETTSKEDAGLDLSESSHYLPGDLTTVLLSEVNFLGNRLSVSYKSVGDNTTRSDVLNEMEIRDAKGALVRSIKFYVTPHNNRTSLTKLDSIHISAPGTEDRVWSFQYNSSNNVPSIYTTMVDHWGFCAGTASATEYILPSIQTTVSLDMNGFGQMKSFPFHYSGINRSPSTSGAQLGILNMITDPQGLQTKFTYEGNYGAFRDTSKGKVSRDYLHPVGGLRVSGIETYDPHTRRRIRKFYQYGLTKPNVPNYEPVWGGGAIKHIVTQRDYCSSVMTVQQDPYNNSCWKENLIMYGSMPVCEITFNNGSAVMYNIVQESVQGDDGTWTKNMYYYKVNYHDFEDLLVWDDDDPRGSVDEFVLNSITDNTKSLVRSTPYLSDGPRGDFTYGASNQLNGALLRTEYYDGKELVASTENTYTEKYVWDWPEIEIPQRRVVADKGVFEGSPYDTGNNPMYTTHYELVDIATNRQLDKEISRRYINANGRTDTVTIEKRYTYNYNWTNPSFSLKPRQMQTTRSDGATTTDEYDYLANYPGILSYQKHTEGASSKESRIQFRNGSCLPERIQSRTDQQPNYRDEVAYRHYDNNGNPIEIASKDSVPISFIWSYRNRFPIARIENATIGEVYSAIGVTDLDICAESDTPSASIWGHINSLRVKLPEARVTTYEYSPLQGVVSIIDPNNVVTKFDYDSYSRLTDGYYLDANARKVMLQKYIYNFGK